MKMLQKQFSVFQVSQQYEWFIHRQKRTTQNAISYSVKLVKL